MVLPAGFEDEEYVVESLQRRLCSIIDDGKCKELLSELESRGLRSRSNRLQELSDPSVCHRWLWKASPVHGPIAPSCEFLLAVRLRLGAACADATTRCTRCNALMGEDCAHGLLCARPEATKGHYHVRDEMLCLAHLADPSTTPEAIGLIPSAPALRLADLLTSAAIPGCTGYRGCESRCPRDGKGLLPRHVLAKAPGLRQSPPGAPGGRHSVQTCCVFCIWQAAP